MHMRDFWQSAPTTRPAIRAMMMGACIEPGPSSLAANREGTSRTSTNSSARPIGRVTASEVVIL